MPELILRDGRQVIVDDPAEARRMVEDGIARLPSAAEDLATRQANVDRVAYDNALGELEAAGKSGLAALTLGASNLLMDEEAKASFLKARAVNPRAAAAGALAGTVAAGAAGALAPGTGLLSRLGGLHPVGASARLGSTLRSAGVGTIGAGLAEGAVAGAADAIGSTLGEAALKPTDAEIRSALATLPTSALMGAGLGAAGGASLGLIVKGAGSGAAALERSVAARQADEALGAKIAELRALDGELSGLRRAREGVARSLGAVDDRLAARAEAAPASALAPDPAELAARRARLEGLRAELPRAREAAAVSRELDQVGRAIERGSARATPAREVLHHGTPWEIEQLDASRPLFLSRDPDLAREYAMGAGADLNVPAGAARGVPRVYDIEVDPRSLLDARKPGHRAIYETLRQENPNLPPLSRSGRLDWFATEDAAFADALRRRGFAGAVLDEGGGRESVMLLPGRPEGTARIVSSRSVRRSVSDGGEEIFSFGPVEARAAVDELQGLAARLPALGDEAAAAARLADEAEAALRDLGTRAARGLQVEAQSAMLRSAGQVRVAATQLRKDLPALVKRLASDPATAEAGAALDVARKMGRGHWRGVQSAVESLERAALSKSTPKVVAAWKELAERVDRLDEALSGVRAAAPEAPVPRFADLLPADVRAAATGHVEAAQALRGRTREVAQLRARAAELSRTRAAAERELQVRSRQHARADARARVAEARVVDQSTALGALRERQAALRARLDAMGPTGDPAQLGRQIRELDRDTRRAQAQLAQGERQARRAAQAASLEGRKRVRLAERLAELERQADALAGRRSELAAAVEAAGPARPRRGWTVGSYVAGRVGGRAAGWAAQAAATGAGLAAGGPVGGMVGTLVGSFARTQFYGGQGAQTVTRVMEAAAQILRRVEASGRRFASSAGRYAATANPSRLGDIVLGPQEPEDRSLPAPTRRALELTRREGSALAIREALGALDDDLQTSAALQAGAEARLDYLAQHAPKIYGKGNKRRISEMERLSWERRVEAAEDPLGALHRAASAGTVSRETMETLDALYPDVAAAFRRSVLAAAAERGADLDHQTRMALSLATGLPLDPSWEPSTYQFLQAAGGAPAAAPTPTGRPPAPEPPTDAQATAGTPAP